MLTCRDGRANADIVVGIEGASALSRKAHTAQLGVGEHRSVSGTADARPSGACLLQDIARHTCAQLLHGLLSKFMSEDLPMSSCHQPACCDALGSVGSCAAMSLGCHSSRG